MDLADLKKKEITCLLCVKFGSESRYLILYSSVLGLASAHSEIWIYVIKHVVPVQCQII